MAATPAPTIPGPAVPGPVSAAAPTGARRDARATRHAAARQRTKLERDGLIMDTNKSSIVSKRSVEKLYFCPSPPSSSASSAATSSGEPEFFRHFVSKFKRRSPLINRGYWLRMKAVEGGVRDFLEGWKGTGKRKVVVNLGCGYDPLPFMILSRWPELCGDTTFVDVDYPDLMNTKIGVVERTEQLRGLVPGFRRVPADGTALLGSGENYAMVACDLIDTAPLDRILRDRFHADGSEVALLFVSEVSTAYMERDASQAVFRWTASYPNVRVVLLEQHVPDGVDHPFAQTMMAHFDKLRTPLRAVGTMEQMRQRFIAAGYPDHGIDIRTLWELWSDPGFQTEEQRRALDLVEPFDEWEEFALYGSHYFLLTADKKERNGGSDSRLSEKSGSAAITSGSPITDHRHSRDESLGCYSTTEDALQTHEIREPHDFRRFAAIIPPSASENTNDSLGLHGGMGTRERLDGCATYACVDGALKVPPPPLRSGIMCHSINRLGTTSDCLLIGGRTSPDKAIAECWTRRNDVWRRAPSLPSGRFRHAAVSIVLPNSPVPEQTVLIFGGKRSDGNVLDEWLIWGGEEGWKPVPVAGDSPSARFGATMITDGVEGLSGVLVGGMNSAGIVLSDFWYWELSPDLTLRCRNETDRATALLQGHSHILGRYAAQLVRSSRGILMIGGITGGQMLTRQDEIVNMKTLRPQPLQGPRPLFIGCSIQNVDGGLIILGGGATCFSFGTTWNRSCILNDAKKGTFDTAWRFVATESPSGPTPAPVVSHPEEAENKDGGSMPDPTIIQRFHISPELSFHRHLEARRPVVLTECDIGPCTAKWDTAYLKATVGASRTVSVHVASSEKMDFQTKNFAYETQGFDEFLDGVERGEKLYLRSLSRDAPSEKPTNLADDFPGIASDFGLPAELATAIQSIHSSPLRISGPVQMWLHYDVMANVLCQVRGEKRVILFPPSDIGHLGFEPGASSSSLDIFGATTAAAAGLSNTHPMETVMRPGDILLIPPMWLHTTAPTSGASVAVNVFFRNLENGYAAGRDVYGNRDLAAYEKGRKDVSKIVKSFDDLPNDVSAFYLERLAMEMLEKARFLSRSMSHDPRQ